MPLRLRAVSWEGATCLRVAAKDWRARDEGANWTVDGARAADGVTGTMAQLVDCGVREGAQGAMAMCNGVGGVATWSSSSWAARARC